MQDVLARLLKCSFRGSEAPLCWCSVPKCVWVSWEWIDQRSSVAFFAFSLCQAYWLWVAWGLVWCLEVGWRQQRGSFQPATVDFNQAEDVVFGVGFHEGEVCALGASLTQRHIFNALSSARIMTSRFARYAARRKPLCGLITLTPAKGTVTAAQRLLLDTHLTLAEIAERCGFRHPEYMGMVFKAETKQTPAKFRHQALAE